MALEVGQAGGDLRRASETARFPSVAFCRMCHASTIHPGSLLKLSSHRPRNPCYES